MHIELPFGREVLTVEVPDTARVLSPVAATALPNPLQAVRLRLNQPQAGPPLREHLHRGQHVAIVISDITRPVPNQTLLPPILDELKAAGIADDEVTIVNGTGLHRPNTPAELDEMLGSAILRRYRVVQHDAFDAATLVRVGTSRGVPVELCRAYVEADVLVVTGFVEPHLFAGYSGGAKGVMPGVAGAGIVMSNHGAANLSHPRARWLTAEGNPVFEEMQAVVDLCPPAFLLNVTLDPQRRITGVFAGDWREAHAMAVEQAERQYCVAISHPYDIVIVTNMGYPADTTLYQSVKGMSVAAEGVRDGGAIILVAACDEGIGGDAYTRLLTGGKSPESLLEEICSFTKPRHDQWQVQCQAMVQSKAEVYLHSHLTRGQTEAAHLRYVEDVASTVRELVAQAQSEGHDGSVLVLPHGQLTVPVPDALT